ncbi:MULTISPECIES: energy transducer TonB [Zhongshania]|jgi:protein TonB|uniref:Energy transducer TonB n=1 Tax=Zhongshania aquimaris TaxID=2857107 RepID=A0ABS6VQP5_9GAMM|nr:MULTISPECIES: energy transducer TonB [Zhongshania]MBQ0795011.1 energy transducer TonB [Zhongshania sp.]MBW2940639.1 energy transducer TonB [Zhongshania aquimaris]|tara:strand:- start:5781 stop:6380 length:600 start_codon:yes stop_codon:yes gene_type:complete
MNIRLLIGAALAFVVTASLFILMPYLIEMADKTLDEKPRTKLADIQMPDTKIETMKDNKPDKPKEPDEPPPDMEQPEMEDINPNLDVVNMTPSQSVDLTNTAGGLSASDGEYLPIVKVAPIYPRRAQSRGVTGYCTVEYTVTKAGTTRDIVAVDCQPAGYFERASEKAAEKFKYKPRVSDGEPIEVPGIQNRFTYELEK